MIAIMTPTKAKKKLAENMRERRLAISLTQAGLSKRSGVALATLRKFEQSGAVSVDSLFKLCRKELGNLPSITKAHGRIFWE